MPDAGALPRHRTSRWHYTARDSWDRERIVAAMREWAQEVGAPPRSWEWCPGQARSAGLIGAEEHRWEREHPRWPGNTTVYRYFTSWPAALEAAGLPSLTSEHELPFEERVATAVRMAADGLGVPAIADHLGVAAPTVSRYLRAHPCTGCAGPVVGARRLCHRCSARRANPKRWTREEVLAAVHAWVAEEGRRPTQADWRPPPDGQPPNRWQRELPRWPPASVGRIVFGGWTELLAEAGWPEYNHRWTHEEIIAALREFGDRWGRPPTKSEWETVETGRHPSSPTVRRAFGTFTAGIRAAGLEPVRTAWSRERIIEAARGFERERGRAPRGADWSRATPDSPSAATVYNHFGHWDEMLRAAREPD